VIGDTIYINLAPQNIINKSIIVIYDNTSFNPIQPIHHLEEPAITIQILSNDTTNSYTTLNNIIYQLIDKTLRINCNKYLGIYCETTPAILKFNDKTNQIIYSTTLRCIRANKGISLETFVLSASEINITFSQPIYADTVLLSSSNFEIYLNKHILTETSLLSMSETNIDLTIV
jgi:hypothetical protein